MTKVSFIYAPGKNPGRAEYPPERYTKHQNAIYVAVSQAVYAFESGLLGSLMPVTGRKVDVEDFHAWRQKALYGWKQESQSRGRGVTRGIQLEDFPENAWIWLYQRIRDAPPIVS